MGRRIARPLCVHNAAFAIFANYLDLVPPWWPNGDHLEHTGTGQQSHRATPEGRIVHDCPRESSRLSSPIRNSKVHAVSISGSFLP